MPSFFWFCADWVGQPLGDVAFFLATSLEQFYFHGVSGRSLANSWAPRNNFSELTSSRFLRRLVRRRVKRDCERERLPNRCVNINEGTGSSAAILNQFVTELDHCIVRDCEVSRGRKNAAGLFFKGATSWSARTSYCEGR